MLTLLQKFIKNKVAAYTEPTRKRVPKGHKIGFPLSKFHASLLCLTVSKGEAIATKVGVSHTQLRVWKTEPGFKVMLEQNAQEFAGVFVDYLIEKGKELCKISQETARDFAQIRGEGKAHEEWLRKEVAESAQGPATYTDIADLGSYQPFLIILIVRKLLTVKVPKEIESYVDSLMWYVLRTFGHDKAPELKSQVIPFKRSVERVLDEAMQLVLKPNLTDGERQQILILLTTVKSIL